IGIAVGQRLTGTATAVTTIPANDGVPDWNQLEKIVDDWQPSLFVVGLPLNMADTDSEMSVRAAKFARRVSGRFNIPYVTMDERLSTFESRSGEDVKDIDAMAAKLILESWLRQ
ncbi:MAG: Holliday junction resolvase RuvX, partial [Pseudomonadales bacterium]|nr:Holliday junction resolvase RuvX [Pseudomonadales bacterium]